MLQLENSKYGNNVAIGTKEIHEEFMEYLISKGAISWLRRQSLRSFQVVIFVLAASRPS